MKMEKPTGAKRHVNGVEFVCWHTGINKFEYRSMVGVIYRSHTLTGYHAQYTNGESVRQPHNPSRRKTFRSFENAAKALIKEYLNQHYAEEDMRP
jgi:hypothetical protein